MMENQRVGMGEGGARGRQCKRERGPLGGVSILVSEVEKWRGNGSCLGRLWSTAQH